LEGTVTFICVGEIIVNAGAFTPLKDTVAGAKNPVPVITTLLPCAPLTGLKDVIVGGTNTVKLFAEDPLPAWVSTVILPVTAPAGTLALI
jgi:hypothetical protein